MHLTYLVKDPFLATETVTPKSAEIWQNLNTFGSRCLGAGIVSPYYQAMYALRSALEEELSIEMGITECRIQVACAWISHAGKPLLRWAQDNIGYMDVKEEDEANYVEGGLLYKHHGPSTMCLRRWGFWLDRFEEFGKKESGMSEDIQKASLEAALTMKTIERGIAPQPLWRPTSICLLNRPSSGPAGGSKPSAQAHNV